MDPNLDDRREPLPPPRFSLAALLWIVGLLAVFFTGMHYLSGHATMLLAMFALAVFAHVSANALGTRLRECGNRPLTTSGRRPFGRPRRPTSSDFAPTTQLGKRGVLGRSTLIATAVGAVVGASLGGTVLTSLMQRITVPAVALAVAASAILGGIWTFAAASCIQVGYSAAKQATREEVLSDEQ